jgi:hypothetical protein
MKDGEYGAVYSLHEIRGWDNEEKNIENRFILYAALFDTRANRFIVHHFYDYVSSKRFSISWNLSYNTCIPLDFTFDRII